MLLTGGLAAAAAAQTLYKSIMPDGQVIYADKPVPGAAKVETQRPAPAPRSTAPAPQAAPMPGGGAAPLPGSDAAPREAAAQRERDARQALASAEAALASGKEPREGERTGIAGGGTRLNDSYWARQKSLEAAVQEARRNLDAVLAGK